MKESLRGTIVGWPVPTDVASPVVVVAQKSELEEVRYFASEGAAPEPAALYYVVPEARQYASVLQYWLKYSRFPEWTVACEETTVGHFFGSWEMLCRSPFSVSSRELVALGRSAPPAVEQAIPSLANVVDFLRLAHVEIVQTILCNEGAYSDYRPLSDTRSWWRQAPAQATRVAEALRELERKGQQCEALRVVFDSIARFGDFIAKFREGNTVGALDSAASCCFMAAEAQKEAGHTVTAVLFLHRTLDLFLQARCSENGLLRETGDGFEFTRGGRERPVGVLNCYATLVDHQVYVRKKRIREVVWACNEIRNNLVLTHSVFGATAQYAERYRQNIEAAMREIDAAAARRVMAWGSETAGRGGLDPFFIFAFEEDLGTCVVESNVTQRSAQAD